MEVTLKLVYMCAIVILSVGLLLWFIFSFVPSMVIKRPDDGGL